MPLFAAAVASLAVVGADSRWLAALGPTVAHSLPFATAPTRGWHDVPVLAQSVFHALESAFGDRGLVAAQVLAAYVAFTLLPRGGARAIAVAGVLPSLVVVRAELFSLVLFPLLLLLLERDARRLWLAVPLLALWSNLHGSVLVGLALLWVYVLVERRRQWPVAVAGSLAVCATPQLWHTPAYYAAVVRNEAAVRGAGLWRPVGLRPLDVLLVAGVLALAVAATRARTWRAWEAVACAGLAAATVHSARIGTWLVLVACWPAARALGPVRVRGAAIAAAVLGALVVARLAVGPADAGDARLARLAARTGQPVLAEPIPAEQVELAGGRVWVADPIDAFRRDDQRLYLDWLEGHGSAAVAHARYVLVARTSAPGRAAARDARLAEIARNRGYVLYRVR